MYALGACLYTLVFGRIPFSAPNLYKLFQVVQHEAVKYPDDVAITQELQDLLARMLTKVKGGGCSYPLPFCLPPCPPAFLPAPHVSARIPSHTDSLAST